MSMRARTAKILANVKKDAKTIDAKIEETKNWRYSFPNEKNNIIEDEMPIFSQEGKNQN